MRKILGAMCLALACAPGLSAADLEAGQRALGRSDYAAALKELRPLAERGNAEAQFSLGQMYSYGRGVSKDEAEAARWYREAARQGHARARRVLANLCELGLGAQDVPDADRWKSLSPVQLVREGRSLCAKAAEQLEVWLGKRADDLPVRYRLLGYYFHNGPDEIGVARTIEARRRHIFWLIQHSPASEVAGFPEATIDPAGHPLADAPGYAEGGRLWLEQSDQPSAVPAVFLNGARFFQLNDKPRAEQLLLKGRARFGEDAAWDGPLGYLYAMAILGVSGLNHTGIPVAVSAEQASSAFAAKAWQVLAKSERPVLVGVAGQILSQYGSMLLAFGKSKTGEMRLAEQLLTRADRLQPDNPAWADVLGQHLARQARLGPAFGGGPDTLKRALGYLEKSLAHTADVEWRMGRQRELAKLSFELGEDARAQSHASELLALAQRHPGDETYGAALHDGHMVLGRLALKRKSVAEARAHLLDAGRTIGGSTLSSFGPNMGLAKDLLDQGERQVVIEYLRLCKNFWTGPHLPVDAWIAEIQAGRKPNFGPNLNY